MKCQRDKDLPTYWCKLFPTYYYKHFGVEGFQILPYAEWIL